MKGAGIGTCVLGKEYGEREKDKWRWKTEVLGEGKGDRKRWREGVGKVDLNRKS